MKKTQYGEGETDSKLKIFQRPKVFNTLLNSDFEWRDRFMWVEKSKQTGFQ